MPKNIIDDFPCQRPSSIVLPPGLPSVPFSASSDDFPEELFHPVTGRSSLSSTVGEERGGRQASLPCLNNDNTDGADIIDKFDTALSGFFSPYRKKTAFVLLENAQRFVDRYGLEYVGFLTLTFPDNVTDHREAYRRFCNLRKCFLSVIFGEYLMVKERQIRGAWHFHLLIQVHQDIRTGFNFDEVFPGKGRRGRYSSASPYLRSIWQEMRQALPRYGFGRAELAPIRSTGEAMAKYVGKYLEQNVINTIVNQGEYSTKGVRLTSASKGWPVSSPKFAWNTEGGKVWRDKVAALAAAMGYESTLEFRERWGERWAWLFSKLFADGSGFDPRDLPPKDHMIDEHGAIVPDPKAQAKTLMQGFTARRTAYRRAKARINHAKAGLCLSRGYVQMIVDFNRWLDIPDEEVPF